MSRTKKHPPPGKAAEALIRSAGSIGALERLAGIGPDLATRTAFWLPFAKIAPASASLEAGIAELKTRIHATYRSKGASSC